ncbi:hypothetical protein [Kosakonia oryzae]|uniref:Uncharacterized protein n=1 Tax=Kosakonia oryzae TaxID=497725 RepID=A0AA94H1R1_9ENTR|nr:hypothetical protein [Kosakonia oryzae]QSV12317.1 hypothetical protein AWR26_25020 [Kosakonia oryzae]SFC02760.1 hypothetical protein SAMN05216286_1345 [Kosakonia oryzae]
MDQKKDNKDPAETDVENNADKNDHANVSPIDFRPVSDSSTSSMTSRASWVTSSKIDTGAPTNERNIAFDPLVLLGNYPGAYTYPLFDNIPISVPPSSSFEKDDTKNWSVNNTGRINLVTYSPGNSFYQGKLSSSNETLSENNSNPQASILWSSIFKRVASFEEQISEHNSKIVSSQKSISKIMLSLAKQTSKMKGFDTSLSNAEDRLEQKVKDFENELITARNSLLAVIALFASFFTFISISVNIFSRDMSLATSISVLLVIWSCLISFIFVFMAGISKGGEFFTSSSFIKHAVFMVVLFFSSFGLPRIVFHLFPIN